MRYPSNTLNILRISLLLLAASLQLSSALAWDSVGHRLTAAVANQYLEDTTQAELMRILQEHPRYERDFLEQMPASIARSDERARFEWLLGQAAFWPDIARGLPRAERDLYHRANWHYIDGAWLRGEADSQGNTYIGVSPLPDIQGGRATLEFAADNVMTALDYNTTLLADQNASLVRRAVALCWVLHLIGDIHQPLHVGSLYSTNRFANSDRGGNGIETDEGNLHARWDRALRSEGVSTSLAAIVARHSETLKRMGEQDDADWARWMNESRALLLNTVYTEEMKSEIARSDSAGIPLRQFTLDANYVETMEYHSAMRLALAGRRLALWFNKNL